MDIVSLNISHATYSKHANLLNRQLIDNLAEVELKIITAFVQQISL